jgi:hypothetical protein
MPCDFVSVLVVPVDEDTASENSLLYPILIVAVGPAIIQPAIASTENPWLFV